MCNAPKYGEVEERTGYGGGYNDRGVVEYIERQDSDDEYDEVTSCADGWLMYVRTFLAHVVQGTLYGIRLGPLKSKFFLLLLHR
jgi:hypothetical protein